MGIAYSPRIVTDGLVLCLDAANPKSYPGTGTTWTDLSGNGNNGTLVNGVGYSSDNKGSMTFDGVNDYISTPVALSLYTIDISFKISQFTGSDMRLAGAYSGSTNQLTVGWSNNTFRLWLQNLWVNTSFISEVEVFYFVNITHENSNTKIYVNGVFDSVVLNRTSYFNNLGFGNPFIGTIGNPFNGNIFYTKIYNRALSEPEIQQNFQATRGRYGI